MISKIEQESAESKTIKSRKTLLLIAGGIFAGLLVGWLAIRMINRAAPHVFHGTEMQTSDLAPNFTLTGSGGEQISLRDFKDKVVMLYFGYMFCPDVCPATMVELKTAVNDLGSAADDVQVIMISVDPLRDTPEKLQEYVTGFHPSFIGVTGSEEEVAAAAAAYGIFYEKHEGTPETGYLIDHTAAVVVVDKEGHLRVLYPFNTPGADIADDLRHLAQE